MLEFDADQVMAARPRYMAVCDACHHSLPEDGYQAAEAAAGPLSDPPCPRCGVRLWSFHRDDQADQVEG